MKQVLIVVAAVMLLWSCGSEAPEMKVNESGQEYFGAEINADDAISPEAFKAAFLENGSDSMFVAVSGEVSAVCKKKGCWMTMDMGEGDELFVKFKDYEYFVPLNCEGRTATIEGWAYKEEMSVAELQHYAEDEGKSEEEIAAIMEPEVSYSFMADGVVMD